MRLALLLILFVTFSGAGFGQDQLELPISWTNRISDAVEVIDLPPLDLQQVIQEDLVNDQDKSLPWRYGISRSIELNPNLHGQWTTLSNGSRVWRVGVRSPGALTLSVNFDQLIIPQGGQMFLYNGSQTELSRPYSYAENTQSGRLGSWFLEGEVIWIEYYEPAAVVGQIQLQVGSLIHGYRLGLVTDALGRGLNDSGACNYDVNCSVGADFDSYKSQLKKAVALLNLGNGFLCTATLLNNALEDKTPFLLTGNHCLDGSDPSLWSVRFNWVSPNPVCGTGENSTNLESNFTMSGAELRASNTQSDFALVELSTPIPRSWDVAFAGWDNTDVLPEYEIGIHHPKGDIMKISRDDSGAVKEVAGGMDVWLIGGVSAGTGDGWEIGTTESGSSGSPLFNQNGHLIGQLLGGESECLGTETNNDFDLYGRFAISWDQGATPETRLMDWLDPNESGIQTVETLQNVLSVPDFEISGQLQIYPNPAQSFITVMNTRYPNLEYRFYTVIGQQVKAGSLSNTDNAISVEALAEGVYFLHLIDGDSGAEVTKKIVVERP